MDFLEQIHGDVWKEDIILSSVPLWKYDKGKPVANASGCLIDYAGCRFLLSIAHATIAESEWNAEVKSVNEKDGELHVSYQPIEMNCLAQFKAVPEKNDFTEPKIVDFTYRRLPKDFMSTHVIAIVGNELLQAERTIFTPDFRNIILSSDKKYGFYGNVRFSGTEGRRIVFEHRLEHDLTFIEKSDDHLVFRLSHRYGSHANYEGCSGAPVIDSDGQLVGLVSFGEKSTNCIYAIDICKYRAALEMESQP